MKGIVNALWNYPSVAAGALQIANVTLTAEGTLPTFVAIPLAIVTAIAQYAAVSPARPNGRKRRARKAA
jgi:uncharacterized membrane protein YphA (DoxX/SURF4 family)